MMGCFYHLNLVFYRFWGIYCKSIKYLFVNVILHLELLDLVDLFSANDEIINWGVVCVLILRDTEAGADMEFDLNELKDTISKGVFLGKLRLQPGQ